MQARCRLIALLILLVGLLSACSSDAVNFNAPTPDGLYPLDPDLRELYQELGGSDLLGSVISPAADIKSKNLKCQYTSAALLCYDQNPAATQKNLTYPLGPRLKVADQAKFFQPGDPGRIVDGYQIFPDFVPLYDRLHGALYVGKPLTQPRYNAMRHRYEQFFENMGFYRGVDEPSDQVHLLSYGAYVCDQRCRFPANESSIIDADEPNVEQPFFSTINRWQGAEAVGSILTQPYIAADGNMEQVYQNAVLYAPPGRPDLARMRPLPSMLGMIQTPLEEKALNSRYAFYPVENTQGYNVFKPLDDFISNHGGREASGNPISKLLRYTDENVYRQCFESYCLDIDPRVPDTVRMAPLGLRYLQVYHIDPALVVRFIYSPETINLLMHPAQVLLPANSPQTIYITVLNSADQKPLGNIESVLTLTLPDGQTQSYPIPATDANGQSAITLDPMPQLKNTDGVPYQVCLNTPSDIPICASDIYSISPAQ